jgi:hypothetical protein
VEDGGVEVSHVVGGFDGFVAYFVGGADDLGGGDAGAG